MSDEMAKAMTDTCWCCRHVLVVHDPMGGPDSEFWVCNDGQSELYRRQCYYRCVNYEYEPGSDEGERDAAN